MGNRRNNLQLLMKKIFKINGCWEWTGYISPQGYGRAKVNYKSKQAHRAIYEMMIGEIPVGMQLDHLCRNRKCVNPNHMEVVTCKENILRGEGVAAVNAKKTYCLREHPFDEENTYIRNNKRYCKICEREKTRRLRRQKKELRNVYA